jgi:hypothetical protein
MKCLYLTVEALYHEDIWESGSIDPCILDPGTNGGEWSASRLGYFTLEKSPGTHWIGRKC